MLASRLRQTATMLLESAIRIAPRESRDWGRAMRSELNQVEDNRTAAMWAMGGAGVLAKYTIASALIPGRRGQGLAPDGWLFSRRLSLRRAALFTGIACVLAALVFFAAPPFRQGLRVALQPWYFVFQKTSGDFQPDFAFVINRAETSHDAEGLAFCAVRVENPSESARLAKEAVRLDPNLIWVYAVVGMRHPALPEIGAWADQLERWDSQNALFHLIQAESVRLANLHQGAALLSAEENERAWQNAMLEAFQSPKFDDYLDRVAELNRRVVPRYQFYDPYEVQSREQLDLPSYAFDNAEHFANSLFHSETNLKSKDSHEAGREKYWTVARFGQLIDSQARTDSNIGRAQPCRLWPTGNWKGLP